MLAHDLLNSPLPERPYCPIISDDEDNATSANVLLRNDEEDPEIPPEGRHKIADE